MSNSSFSGPFWSKIDSWFIAEANKTNRHILFKARILACVHLFMVIIVSLISVLTIVVTPENKFSLPVPLFIVSTAIYIFKKYGSLQWSGNILALCFAITLVPMIFHSGGLYSDNLLWLIICPILVMLFCAKRDVFFWLAVLLGFTVFLHKWDVSHPGYFKSQIAGLTSEYYMISYMLLFTVIVMVVFLFKYAEDSIISDLKNTQTTLETQQNELLQTNKQLRQTSELLQRSNRDLESFAYAASHDLKEPLRMIGSYTHLLQRRLATLLNPDTEEMMGFVRQGVNRMQRLLDDVLEYSRVGRGQDKTKMVDLQDVIYYINSTLKLQIEESKTTIVLEKPLPKVFARYSEMTQLFQNLVSNAIKFRKHEIAPEIRLNWFAKGDYFTFSLSDNGIGIEEQFHARVFNLFERLHNRGAYDGSGIGLATCKKIIRNLGGEIWVESQFGVGTTFFFTLPSSEAALQKSLAGLEKMSVELPLPEKS